jgi:peroxiredoxin
VADERFLEGFRTFDVAIEPDLAFAERLFDQLSAELGIGGVTDTPPIGIGDRIRRSLRFGWGPVPAAAMRVAWLVASLALLLVLLGTSVFVANRLWSRPSPLDIVRSSQATVKDPPAFVLTYRIGSNDELKFSYDGAGTWRSDEVDGSYSLWDGSRQGYFNASMKTWGVGEGSKDPPFMLLINMWAWASTAVPGSEGVLTPVDCADALWVAEAAVAGRSADQVRCPSWDTDYWIDRESRLVLRFIAGPTTPGWIGDVGEVTIRGMEASSLDLSPPVASDFSWTGPPGAYDEEHPPASTVLAVGEPVPTLTATTIDGDSLALPVIGRPTAVLFTGTSYGGRSGRTYDGFVAAAAAHAGVTGAIVTNAMAGTAAGFRLLHPTALPLVGDWDSAVWQAWGVNTYPTLVLVDASGDAVTLTNDEISGKDLERMLAALETGSAPPAYVAVTPAPTASFVPVPEDAVTEIAIGDLVPEWGGLLMDGSRFDSTTLRGRPFVLTNFAQSECETCAVDYQLEAFKAMSSALGERAAFVLVGNGEAEPGTTARQMERLGIDVPVVMDWDGTVADALRWVVMGTIVVDADGRLAAVFPTLPDDAAMRQVLDRLEAGAPPSP